MKASTVISAARDRAVYAGIRSAISLSTMWEPDATLNAFAKMGRLFAGAPFNRKRLDRAVGHLSEAFPDWSLERKREFALLGYEHLAMLGAEMTLTPRLMSNEGWADRARLEEIRPALAQLLRGRPCLLVTGHVGNWEVCGHLMALLGFRMHAIYRPLDLAPLDAWVRETRSRRGLYLLDKFETAESLPGIFRRGETAAFVADQNAGVRGMFVPFFGRLASSYKAIGLMAQRFGAPVVVGWAKRVGGSEAVGSESLVRRPQALRFDLRIADAFGPEDWEGRPDPLFYITARYRRALEQAFTEAPDQVLWMHRFWKSRPLHERKGKPFPAALERKLRELPWMTDAEVERIKARSAQDAAEFAADPKNARQSEEPEEPGLA
ncbi:MAG: lysophospholipid acyltransferase family protein [Phycisphaerales bacterium]